jgi:Zn-finger nucleic acid-binding protein
MLRPMECPRCTTVATRSPYRVSPTAERRRPALEEFLHGAGVQLDACGCCGGVFLDHGEMQALERFHRERGEGTGDRAALAFQQSYRRARAPEQAEAKCPRCGDDLFERDWSMTYKVGIEVCIGCRGVWVTSDALDTLEKLFALG